MSNPKDAVNRTVSGSQSEGDPVQIIISCVKAMDRLKSSEDQKLNMSLSYLQSEISRAVRLMVFKKAPHSKAVNENVQTKH